MKKNNTPCTRVRVRYMYQSLAVWADRAPMVVQKGKWGDRNPPACMARNDQGGGERTPSQENNKLAARPSRIR